VRKERALYRSAA